MSRYFAILADGAVENVVVGEWPGGIDVTEVFPLPGIGWTYDGETFTPPAAVDLPPSLDAPRIITQRAFRGRMTIAELVGIEIASLDDPAVALEQRKQAATLRVLLETLRSATFVDLDFADTRMGLQMIGQFGLLTSERVAEILDAAVEDFERP